MTDDVDVSDARLQLAQAQKIKALERALNDAIREAWGQLGMHCELDIVTLESASLGDLETVRVSVFRRLA